jgi:hypothetical protein
MILTLQRDEQGKMYYGSNSVNFVSSTGWFVDVLSTLQSVGPYSPLSETESGKWKAVPNDGKHHIFVLEKSSKLGNPCSATFHYTAPNGQNQIKDRIVNFRERLSSKLEVLA